MKKIRQFLTLTCVLVLVCMTFGCGDGSGSSSGSGGNTNPDPAGIGNSTTCTYVSGLSNPNYASAVVYYPCTGSGPFSATTLTGGFTNTKEDMDWLASHLTTHGFIIIAMTPNNNLGTNPEWTAAHMAGISVLKSENSRSSSPIYGKVNTNALQIMGFSKGGGGALLASANMGSQIKATQAMAPYMDFAYNLNGVSSTTICYTSTADFIAFPRNVVDMYNSLPDSITRTLAYFEGISHTDWYGSSGNYRDRMKTYITSWMKVYLDNNSAYGSYIQGNQGWFFAFARNEDYTGSVDTTKSP
jgi:hypothetical protein